MFAATGFFLRFVVPRECEPSYQVLVTARVCKSKSGINPSPQNDFYVSEGLCFWTMRVRGFVFVWPKDAALGSF